VATSPNISSYLITIMLGMWSYRSVSKFLPHLHYTKVSELLILKTIFLPRTASFSMVVDLCLIMSRFSST
jgi:hypothetical protein